MEGAELQDKAIERARYDGRAGDLLAQLPGSLVLGSRAMPAYLAGPYIHYEAQARSVSRQGLRVLEIGAGTGMHSLVWLESGAQLVATDIAPNALVVLKSAARSAGYDCETHVADMERLPFADGSFDCVATAGALSYGDNRTVLTEIHRVLKPGGVFLCVDSLNHNPVYRLNRWLHYLRGHRSRSTLARMPTIDTIALYSRWFAKVECQFFGAVTWLGPLLSVLFGGTQAANVLNRLDCMTGVRWSAFKFVMKASKRC